MKEDIKRVESKTEELNVLQEDLKQMKEGMEDIRNRVNRLENVEKNVVEEMKKHMERLQEEENRKNKMKMKILEEIAEEEKCCLVIGFPIVTTRKKEVLDGLITAIVKEETNTDDIKESVKISWMKDEEGPKKSVIILSLRSKSKRDWFLLKKRTIHRTK